MTRRPLIATMLACALAGCVATPSTPLPIVPLPSRWTATAMPVATAGSDDVRDRAQSLTDPVERKEDWWSVFGGSRVDALVRAALAGNPSVTAAAATLRQAHELTLAQSASFWPTLSVGVGAVQAHGSNASVINSGAPSSRTALLSASYTPDLFGLNASNLASTKAQEDATRWQLEAGRLTLAGAVLNALTAEKSALRVEQLTQRLVSIDTDVLTILRSRESLGDVATAAVWAQSQQVHDRQAQLAAARLQTAQARDLLASLLGDAPANFVEPDIDFDELALPDFAPRLPGDVIGHRPDVQMAAAQLQSANATHQAAIAALLPQVTLSGDAGYVSATIKRLFDPASLVWDLGASATQSLFDAGAQRHRAAAAQALADAQSAQYRAAIIGAFKDVADGLEAVSHDAQGDVEAIARVQAAQRQFEIASKSHALGEISRQDLLVAQAQMIQMQLLQVQARASRLVDAANVMVSLGGSLENDDAQPAATSGRPLAIGLTSSSSTATFKP
jgi:NodT family efflux transporter outer membrane factor (OMF) lipoprotein